MSEFNIINLNKFSWQMNVAIMGAVFSVFSLIYNDQFIYYGFAVFGYGIFAHMIHHLAGWLWKEDGKHYWAAHVTNIVTAILWFSGLKLIF